MDMKHFDDLSLSIYSDGDMLFMIKATADFFNKNHKPTAFHAKVFYTYVTVLLDELSVHHLEQKRRAIWDCCTVSRKK